MSPPDDSASSYPIGIILLIAVSIILTALVLVMALQFSLPGPDTTPPDLFRISRIMYTLSADGKNYIGLVVVANTADKDFRNRYLKVNTYINGNPADCRIPTLNNDLFIQSDHTGVARLQGLGTRGSLDHATAVWPANSEISIEYEKRKMRPGDKVTLEFVDTTTGRTISRDTWPHTETRDAQWFYRYFLNHQAA